MTYREAPEPDSVWQHQPSVATDENDRTPYRVIGTLPDETVVVGWRRTTGADGWSATTFTLDEFYQWFEPYTEPPVREGDKFKAEGSANPVVVMAISEDRGDEQTVVTYKILGPSLFTRYGATPVDNFLKRFPERVK